MSKDLANTANIHSAQAHSETHEPRRIALRTRGHGEGPIVRLMSPSDLGELIKPFVFLDLFDMNRVMLDVITLGGGMPLHPHSGVATVTVLTEGKLRYEDPSAGFGVIDYGGVEWMRAGNGVWHGREMAPMAGVPRVQGFQLWLALPPELENGEPDSRYIESKHMPRVGPAHIIVGTYEGIPSPVPAPQGINYLLVTLPPGERWEYRPPAGHSVGWLSLAKGQLDAGSAIAAGEMAVFEVGEQPLALESISNESAVFVLGSAIPHAHAMHLGRYSVHTSPAALVEGERRIGELGRMLAESVKRRMGAGTMPVFR